MRGRSNSETSRGSRHLLKRILTMTTSPVILIAGITGGIGAEVARRLGAAGWRVAGFARDQAKLAALSAELPSLFTVSADATQPAEVAGVVQAVLSQFGRIDAYVHAVGSIILKPAHLTKDEEWLRTLDLNLNSAFYALRAVLAPMQAQNSGSIILVSSVAAQVGLPNHEAIAAAKGGINGLVLAAAATYPPRRIRVNAVAPGLVDTPLAAPMLGSEAGRALAEKMHPLGQLGRASHVGSLIAWLASPDAEWVTGQIWSMDGGMAHVRSKPKV